MVKRLSKQNRKKGCGSKCRVLGIVLIVAMVTLTAGCNKTDSQYSMNDRTKSPESNTAATDSKISEENQEFKLTFVYKDDFWKTIDYTNCAYKSQEEFEKEIRKTIAYMQDNLCKQPWYETFGENLTGCTFQIAIADTASELAGAKVTWTASDGAHGITSSIRLDRKLFQAGAPLIAHEIVHAVTGSSFSYSLNDGLCEYVNYIITGKNCSGFDFPIDDFIYLNMKMTYDMEPGEKKDATVSSMNEVMNKTGAAGRFYPYQNNMEAAKSSMWYACSHSFVNYIMNEYGAEAVMNLFYNGKSEEDYKLLDERGYQAIIDDWKEYLEDYVPTMTYEEIYDRSMAAAKKMQAAQQ